MRPGLPLIPPGVSGGKGAVGLPFGGLPHPGFVGRKRAKGFSNGFKTRC
jgi:hypothetical protein